MIRPVLVAVGLMLGVAFVIGAAVAVSLWPTP